MRILLEEAIVVDNVTLSFDCNCCWLLIFKLREELYVIEYLQCRRLAHPVKELREIVVHVVFHGLPGLYDK